MLAASKPSTTSIPSTSGVQLAPPSTVSCTPPPDMPKYKCLGSRGSTMMECSLGPSGVPSCSLPIQARNFASSLAEENSLKVSPPSSLRNSPCGEVPAYQTPGSFAPAGVSQKVCLTLRPPSFLAKEGGRLASRQVRPRSVERKSV